MFALVDLTTQSANHTADRELCLYLLGWAKSCSILDDRDRNPTDEMSIQATVMKETNDESSAAIGCEVWMKLGSPMSCAHLTDRHNLPAEACRESRSPKRKPLNAPEIPGHIL